MNNLQLENILITFIEDNNREISKALKAIEGLDSECNFSDIQTLELEITERETMGNNASNFLKELSN